MDYFNARYYASMQRRFTGADPYDINFERQETEDRQEADALFRNYIEQPQRWNRYVYALNNPLRYIDPDGRKDEEHLVVLLDNQKFKITISDKIDKKEREAILKNIMGAIAKINAGNLTTDEKTTINSLKGIKVTNDIEYSHMDPGSSVFKILPHRVKNSTLDGLTADIIHDSFHADQKRRGKQYRGLAAEKEASAFALSVFERVGVTDGNVIKTFEKDAIEGHYPPKSRAPKKKTP